jgi:hypothetical protein
MVSLLSGSSNTNTVADNTVIGNFIGTNIDGSAALPNNDVGVYIIGGAQRNRIGGNAPGERNLISGNSRDGICQQVTAQQLAIGQARSYQAPFLAYNLHNFVLMVKMDTIVLRQDSCLAHPLVHPLPQSPG